MLEQHTFPNGLVLVAENMPGVQSAAFTLLLPAGAAYEGADGLNLSGGAATMAAEWISRGAGPRDSRELLTALDNLGVSHAESAQSLHTSLAVATLGRNLEPALEIIADMVLRPHLDVDEVEPIRALCSQNLRSLDDDPGTKVIYELRRRHFPDPWGRPSPGTAEGVAALTPTDLRRFITRRTGPTVPSWELPARLIGRDCVITLAGCSRRGNHSLNRAVPERAGGPLRDHILRETQQIQIALAYSCRDGRRPRLLPGTSGHCDPGRLFLGAAFHRGSGETRAVLFGIRQL